MRDAAHQRELQAVGQRQRRDDTRLQLGLALVQAAAQGSQAEHGGGAQRPAPEAPGRLDAGEQRSAVVLPQAVVAAAWNWAKPMLPLGVISRM